MGSSLLRVLAKHPFWVLFAASLTWLGLWRTSDLTIVDGAARCLEVYATETIQVHGNNHLLYPVNQAAFHAVVEAVAGPAQDRLAFFRRSAWLNVIAGAAAVTLTSALARALGARRGMAVLAGLALLSSTAFNLQATSPNETILPLSLSLLGLWLCVASQGATRWAAAALAGGVFAYAMASYQSMAAWGPAAALALCWPRQPGDRWRRGIARAALLGVSFLGSVALIYGWAYHAFGGLDSTGAMLARFFELDGAGDKQVWGHFSVANVLLLPLSLPHMVWAQTFGGVRQTYLHGEGMGMAWLHLLISSSLIYGLSAWAIWRAVPSLKSWPMRSWAILATMTLLPLLPLTYWTPFYNKLWLQPLVGLCIGLALVASHAIDYQPVRQRRWVCVGAAALALILGWNTIASLRPSAQGQAEVLQTVAAWDQSIPADALVFTEWNAESVHFAKLYPAERRLTDIIAVAVDLPSAALHAEMAQQITEAHHAGRSVYFIGILQHDQTAWEHFYERALQLPYDDFAPYREQAIVIATGPQAILYLLPAAP